MLHATLQAHQKGKEEIDEKREKLERKGKSTEIQAEQVKVGKERDEDSVIAANQKETHKAKY